MQLAVKTPITATALADAREAMNFALDHLEPFEVSEFLTEWRAGKDLGPWLDAVKADRE